MKKKLSRNWYKLTLFLNEEFAIPIVDEESHPRRTRYHNNVATVCTTPLTLKTDCMKCVTRRSVVKELVDSYKKLKIIQHQCEETLKRVQDERNKEKHQNIDQRERRKVEKKMASVFNEKSTLNDEFPEITHEQKTFISRAFTDLNSLLGIYLNHRWYEIFTNVMYNGHVVKISHKAKLPKLTITYWTIDESEEEGIDNTITVIEMLVDYLNGDLVFVEDGNDVLQYRIIILLCLIVCVFHCLSIFMLTI